ncbi:MAG: T9SS type A sorting domain-containing protein [Bacteroidota bacterium]|nr:T9SS type A sorting domain-containing protein [Bacteroidota bacterium]
MKNATFFLAAIFAATGTFAQKDLQKDQESVVIYCTDFHITKPLIEIAAENPVDTNMIHPKAHMESPDRKKRKPHEFPFTVDVHGPAYGNDPSTLQKDPGTVALKAPIMNFAGQSTTGFRPMDPSGSVSSTHYIQAINSTTFRVYNKSTGAILSTATVGSLWTPATANDGDPIIMYDKAADRWFISQFGSAGNNIFIAISTTNNPLGSYYTYTFTSPQFPDYLKFGVWTDGYYMTSNQAQKVFAFERTAMLAGTPTARAIYTNFSPPQGSGFFVPMPGDASDGVLPPAGTPCPIFSYSDNGWGGGFTDAVHVYKMAVNWVPATPTATITSASVIPTAAFDGSYSPSWDDISQPGTTQKLDGIGGIVLYRAQWKAWAGYNSVCLTWAVRISATQRSLKWCELRQNPSTGVWTMYQEGIYTPDAATRWMGGIAMDMNGAIALCYLKSDATSIFPGLYYAGRRPCDPLGTLPVTESVAIAGTGSQTGGVNRDGDYSQVVLDPDGLTFWCTSEYMGGPTGANAARTRIFSFQLPTCGPAAPVANFIASTTTPCVGATVNLTDISTNTPSTWAWTFSPGTVTYVGGTTSASQNPQVQFGGAGPYTVTLVASNGIGSDNEVKTSYITPLSPGTLPFVENFELAAFPPTGWSVSSADGGVAWGTAGAKQFERRAAAGNTGSTSGSAGINCYDYNTDTTQIDNLLSKPVSLVGASAPRMTFKRAYKWYGTAPWNDELRVHVSTDCGATFGPALYYKKGLQLATTPGALTTTFTPSVTADWDIDTVDLTAYAGQNIIVKFAVTNKYGQNVYIDDVNITSVAAVASVTITSSDADNIICAGTSVTFTATPTNGGTTPTYQWQVNGVNVGTGGTTYTTSTLTTGQVVTCIMTSTMPGVTGSPDTSNPITMTVNPVPAAPTLGSSTPDCVGQTISLTSNTVAGATYSWTGPSAFTSVLEDPTRPSATAAMAGTYSLTVTVAGCTSPVATTTVVVNAVPAAPTAGSSTPDCVGQTISLTSNTVAGATYSWTGPSAFTSALEDPTRPSATAAMAGTYSVTVTVGGCTSLAGTTTVVVNTVPAAPTAASSSPDCVGSTLSLTSNTVAGATYSWTGPSSFTSALEDPTRPSATVAMSGTYSVTVTVGGCTSLAGTTTVTVAAGPSALGVTTTNSSCSAANGVLAIGTTTGGTGPYTYSVNGGAFTSSTSYPGLIAGTYSVIVQDANGCQFSASGTIVNNPGPTAMAVTTANSACGGSTGSVSIGTVTGGTPAYTYSFNGSAFTAVTSYTGLAAGTYTVTVKDANGCLFTTNPVVGNTSAPTALGVTSTNSNCGNSDGSVTIGAATGGTSPYTYSFNGSPYGSVTTFTGLASGTYPVSVQDASGCIFTTSISVNNTGSTPSTPSVTQSGLVLTSSSATGNQWYLNGTLIPGETGQNLTVTSNGVYSVVVTTGGCSSSASAPLTITSVGVDQMNNPYFLNIYPNPNDGNFIISFSSNDISSYTVELTNALGQLIYREELKDYSGTYSKKMSVVEYGKGVYMVSLTNAKKETIKKIIVY